MPVGKVIKYRFGKIVMHKGKKMRQLLHFKGHKVIKTTFFPIRRGK